MKRLCFLFVSFLLLAVMPAAAEDMARNLRFSPGSSGAVVSGRIQGYDTATYFIDVRGGQRLIVALGASNPQNYFNIVAPMGNQIFDSAMGDDNFSSTVRQTGTYRIQVYLMRAAARRGEESRYKLSVTVPSSGGGGYDDDFADGNAGGPDNWIVRGVPPGDRLMMRNVPRPSGVVVSTLRNGAVVRNRGCRFASGGRWCRVTKNNGVTGWVNGRFLREY
ncbi:MAG: SH3 domain-containing protein [Rhizobiales bacterium]|nr:SH3 domain-containing protein [Hyphomicrobiales bacterium]